MAGATNSLDDKCATSGSLQSGRGNRSSGAGAPRPMVLGRLGAYGTIVLVFGLASLLVLAILLGALVVTIAVVVFLVAAALVCRLPFVRRRLR
jgi:hypothetical protein